MIIAHKGEFAALLTAFFWTFTALAFESLSKKVGSVTVNLIRLSLALVFLSILSWITRGIALPFDANIHQWVWLSLSGLVGFVLGDLFLFQSFVVIGARISMLIMALAPPIAAIIGRFVLEERLTSQQGLGMLLTFIGIALVILKREINDNELTENKIHRVKFSYPVSGLLLAFGGAAGQGGGLVLSKLGMQDYDIYASVQIRIITGIFGFAFFFLVSDRWGSLRKAFCNIKTMSLLMFGAFFGSVLGASFSLWSIRYTATGVSSAIMSIVPVLIIAPSILLFKEKFNFKELVGALITVGGVMLLFL